MVKYTFMELFIKKLFERAICEGRYVDVNISNWHFSKRVLTRPLCLRYCNCSNKVLKAWGWCDIVIVWGSLTFKLSIENSQLGILFPPTKLKTWKLILKKWISCKNGMELKPIEIIIIMCPLPGLVQCKPPGWGQPSYGPAEQESWKYFSLWWIVAFKIIVMNCWIQDFNRSVTELQEQ